MYHKLSKDTLNLLTDGDHKFVRFENNIYFAKMQKGVLILHSKIANHFGLAESALDDAGRISVYLETYLIHKASAGFENQDMMNVNDNLQVRFSWK